MTLSTVAPATVDAAWIAELTAELAQYGYKVTKTRAPRAGQVPAPAYSVRTDGAELANVRSRKHAACAAHWTVPGMDKPVCVSRPGTIDGTAEPIGEEWTDAERVLAFAVEIGAANLALHAAPDYMPADGRADLGGMSRSTYDPERARRHEVHGSIGRKVADRNGSTKLGHSPYGLRIGCETCAAMLADEERAAIRAAELAAMRETPHAFESTADYMATCTACGERKAFEVHTWPAHEYVAPSYGYAGGCRTCERVKDTHEAAA